MSQDAHFAGEAAVHESLGKPLAHEQETLVTGVGAGDDAAEELVAAVPTLPLPLVLVEAEEEGEGGTSPGACVGVGVGVGVVVTHALFCEFGSCPAGQV